MCKDPRTTAKTLVNGLDKSGIIVSKKMNTSALHRNEPEGVDQEKKNSPSAKKRPSSQTNPG